MTPRSELKRYAVWRQAMESLSATCEHPQSFGGVIHVGCACCAVRWLYYQWERPKNGGLFCSRQLSGLGYIEQRLGASYRGRVERLYAQTAERARELWR